MVSSNLQHRRKAFRGGGGPSYLVNQNFETPSTGYDNGESWTEAGTGTVEAANTTTVIAGSQSLQINLVGQTGSTYIAFTAQGSLFCKFRFRVASTNTGNQVVATIRDSSANILGTLTLAGMNRVIRATAGGGSANTSSTLLPLDTNLYIWFEYVKGTGSNAICRAGWATTDTKPTMTATGTVTAVSSNGTVTADATRLYLGNTGTGTVECFFDVVQAAAAAF